MVSLGDVAILAGRVGTRWRDESGRWHVVRKVVGEETAELRRAKRDDLAELLRAKHYRRGRGDEAVHVYTPRDMRIGAVEQVVARFAVDKRVAAFGPRILVFTRLQLPDGTMEWRTASFGTRPDVAFSEAAYRMRAWARGYAPSVQSSFAWKSGERWSVDYRTAKVVWFEIRRLPEREERAHEARGRTKGEAKRWRSVQARDRVRGKRTTRGR